MDEPREINERQSCGRGKEMRRALALASARQAVTGGAAGLT